MYQTLREIPEEEFNNMIKTFEKTVSKITEFCTDEDNSEWDLSKTYIPNHAAIWNQVERINQTCRVISKNSKVAIVMFTNQESGLLPFMYYRLEDLSKNNKENKEII